MRVSYRTMDELDVLNRESAGLSKQALSPSPSNETSSLLEAGKKKNKKEKNALGYYPFTPRLFVVSKP